VFLSQSESHPDPVFYERPAPPAPQLHFSGLAEGQSPLGIRE
jgi:hypothetical protein